MKGYRCHLFPGFRSTALILLACVWLGAGLSLLDRPPIITTHPLPLDYLPIPVRVGVWWVAAVCAVIATFWPPGNDRWGWALLIVPPSLRVVSYGVGGLMGWISYSYLLVWVAIAGLVLLLSFWPEPTPVVVQAPDGAVR